MGKTDVVNMALIALGVDTITEYNEDTKTARLCRAVYNACVDELYQNGVWNDCWRSCKLELAQLPLPTKDLDFRYTYIRPATAYFVRGVGTLPNLKKNVDERWNAHFPFRQVSVGASQYLLSNVIPEEAICIYYEQPNDHSIPYFDANFTQALAHLLASKVAISLTENVNKQNTEIQLYNYYKGQAHANSLNSQFELTDPNRVPDSLQERTLFNRGLRNGIR